MNKKKPLNFLCKDGGYYEIEFNTIRMVCPDCDGEGTELGHGLKGHAFSADDCEPEFLEDYFGDKFDVACSNCHGRNVVDALDTEAIWDSQLTDEQKDDYRRYQDEESAAYWEAEGERRAGA